MTKTLNTSEVLDLIKIEKKLHHKQLQIKILQFEMFEGKHPQMLLQTFNIVKVENELKSLGYSIEYSKTEKSVTSIIKQNKQILKSRNLKTTNMIISW